MKRPLTFLILVCAPLACEVFVGIEDRELVPAGSAGAAGAITAGAGGVSGGSGGTETAAGTSGNGGLGGTGGTGGFGGGDDDGGAAGAAGIGAAGTAGSGGEGGGGGALPCLADAACEGSRTCDYDDAIGCHRSCACVEGTLSCTNDCCMVTPFAGAACSPVAIACTDDCARDCTCGSDGKWACAASTGACHACPEVADDAGPCAADDGTICLYATTSGDEDTACTCAGDEPRHWSCATVAAGGGGAGGAGGSGPSACVADAACVIGEPDCAITASGCTSDCTCAEGTWSCANECCAAAAVANKGCAHDAIVCGDSCGDACSCENGAWTCAGPTCNACPSDLPPNTGDPCLSAAGTACTYPNSDGDRTATCTCIDGGAAPNTWSCASH